MAETTTTATAAPAVNAGSLLGGQPATPGVATLPVAQSSTPPPATTPPAEKPWFDGFADADTKAWAEKKGFKSPEAVAQSARNLEQFVGADKAGRGIVIPKDPGDKAGWDAVYSKLGRPESADKYNIPVPEGDDGEFAKSVAPLLHQAGLTQNQAEVLAKGWNEMQAKISADAAQAKEQQISVDIVDLKREWGSSYDEQYELAKRASREAGVTEESSAKLVNALGAKEAIKMFAKLGQQFAEHRAKGLGDSMQSSTFLTPETAKARLAELSKDREWGNRVLNHPNSAEAQERARLVSIIASGG